MKKQYLITLPIFAGEKGFCHETILVGAKDLRDAINLAHHLRPNKNIGEIKEIN